MNNTKQTPTTYTVSTEFWYDHADRFEGCEDGDDGLGGNTQNVSKVLVKVSLTQAQAHNLLGDADHYSGMGAELGHDFRGLVSSAKATAKRLRKAGVE